ncbi:MAG: hypothetical protein IT365_08225 [Candidatus Hydrogenedentes bacterium]|nr:hypothetical protein [Candidatus Hydrogenedentota bacterium]
MRRSTKLFVCAFLLTFCATAEEAPVLLFEDHFDRLPSGNFFGVVGAHAEYHYLSETAPKEGWVVSAYTSSPDSQLAWKVMHDGDAAVLAQTYANKAKHTHPMIVAGNPVWTDYVLHARFAPQSDAKQSGVVFRYRNDRCYYFCGVLGDRAILKLVQHETAFHESNERILAEMPFAWKPGEYIDVEVTVRGSSLSAAFNDTVTLAANDATFPQGGIGLMSDVPAFYAMVKVETTAETKAQMDQQRAKMEAEAAALEAANPKPVLWKKVRIEGFGVGRNLRFGDLNGDGTLDFLVGQVQHHGPKDRNSELSCLTAMTFEGEQLWQIGKPDAWRDHLTNDVGFQIHDIDGDGRNEVIYCMNQELVVADGATGKTKYKSPTPASPANSEEDYNIFPRILGDSLYFCDLRGTGRDADLIIKDRYRHVWALNDRLEPLWSAECNTGHYPYAFDVNGDGRDELAIGYSLFSPDGKALWTLDESIKDHADGVAIARFGGRAGEEPRLLCAASDEGMFFAGMDGRITKHHHIGHVQNPAIANLRDDLPGLEAVSINFWGNQGIVHFFDAEGTIYHDVEPAQHGSMCLPINWTGKSEEYWVLSPNVEYGGLFDGRGRRVVRFTADGHPDLCNAVLDLTGDCRDEIVVWDPHEVWVYTQDDSLKSGRLYRPERNPLYNYSNYQATVSLPGWSE